MEKAKRILVVDDEETLCEGLRFNLEAEGYDVSTACSAEEALARDLARFDLILLDIMMGEISGIQFARIMKARPSTKDIPIIFCTARDSDEDMVAGLDLGADDYITKPYSIKTILARIRTVLRRVDNQNGVSTEDHDILSFEGLVLSLGRRTCTVDGQEVKMPKKEFEILLKLMSNKGWIFSRSDILNDIWPDEVVVLDRVVDVNITRIRQKIGVYGRHIITRSGYGYGFFE